MFLSWGGFPERGAGRPVSGRSHRLAVSVSSAMGHHFHNGPSFPRSDSLPVLGRSCRPFTREARRLPRSIASAARFVMDLWIGVTAGRPEGCPSGRSRTFTGQCRRPFCPGDSTTHSDGPRRVTKFRCGRRGSFLQGFIRPGSLAHRPSRNVTPPELSPPGPFVIGFLPDAGCIPRLCRVRVETSRRAWTRPGRI
jgi:hypothetical protein